MVLIVVAFSQVGEYNCYSGVCHKNRNDAIIRSAGLLFGHAKYDNLYMFAIN